MHLSGCNRGTYYNLKFLIHFINYRVNYVCVKGTVGFAESTCYLFLKKSENFFPQVLISMGVFYIRS